MRDTKGDRHESLNESMAEDDQDKMYESVALQSIQKTATFAQIPENNRKS